ncbi:uncharacterized protein [Diabrotica undecimpunctata]|uniref:uncharacterized protein n=1 Tax=Diabrotica undecimpunctata TaxID=50387 RepID=UPI003B639741
MKTTILLVTIFVLIALPQSRDCRRIRTDYDKCPETSHDRSLIYHKTIIGKVIHIRIPSTGFFNSPITCLQLTDLTESFSTPIVEEGGYGKKYVVLRVDAVHTGEQLQYDVQIYVDQ